MGRVQRDKNMGRRQKVLSRRDAELACDEATIKRLGEEERASYGRTLIGLTCETEEGEVLGVVTDVKNLSSDVYTIEKAGKQILFPAVKGVIVKTDIAGGKLIVKKSVFDEIAVD